MIETIGKTQSRIPHLGLVLAADDAFDLLRRPSTRILSSTHVEPIHGSTLCAIVSVAPPCRLGSSHEHIIDCRQFDSTAALRGFSEFVVHNRTVYHSGQLADDVDVDMRALTRETLASIDQFLAEAGSDKTRVLSVTIYLKDMADYMAMNAEWDAWVPAGARATVQSPLYDPRVLVEMSVIAAQA
ncbi:Aste57867_24056 [Aphanomyces stellatus]|uniref:Aste57867_24056 protein n=1 Tax=Aphanomyces stellatus TaxID=120398 RepID=A0A485LQ57_9STRA|nr:hypothetical protein As57867_023983 [Aphanomyces stellatus]VFU00699.1 Aste57867_24056 [Aphanomyces stellatus]